MRVMSDLVQRNAKFFCERFTGLSVVDTKTEKVAVAMGKHVWKTVSFT